MSYISKFGEWKISKNEDVMLCEICFKGADYNIEHGEEGVLTLSLCKECLHFVGLLAEEVR